MLVLDMIFIWMDVSRGTKSTGTFEMFFSYFWTLWGLGQDSLNLGMKIGDIVSRDYHSACNSPKLPIIMQF